MNVIIVGGGLFGSLAAKMAEAKGATVTVLDCEESMAASKCSASLLKPSWLSALSKPQIEEGMAVLQEYYGLQTLPFDTLLPKPINLTWVDPAKILAFPRTKVRVVSVGNGFVKLESGEKLEGKVLVAAGVFSNALVEMPPVEALVGCSMRFKGQASMAGLKVWAPYRQAMMFNINKKQIWFGDGTAIVQKNWEEEVRVKASRERAARLFGLEDPVKVLTGARPYVKGFKGGYFNRVYKNTWVSNGGAKNGTILAALQAAQFVREAL